MAYPSGHQFIDGRKGMSFLSLYPKSVIKAFLQHFMPIKALPLGYCPFCRYLVCRFFLAVARYTCDKQPVDNRTIPIQCPITIWAYFYFIHYGEVGNLPVIVL